MAEYSSDDVSTVCGETLKRLKGNMDDKDFKSFVSMIDRKNVKCLQCEDTGLFRDGKGMTVCMQCNYHSVRGRKDYIVSLVSGKK